MRRSSTAGQRTGERAPGETPAAPTCPLRCDRQAYQLPYDLGIEIMLERHAGFARAVEPEHQLYIGAPGRKMGQLAWLDPSGAATRHDAP